MRSSSLMVLVLSAAAALGCAGSEYAGASTAHEESDQLPEAIACQGAAFTEDELGAEEVSDNVFSMAKRVGDERFCAAVKQYLAQRVPCPELEASLSNQSGGSMDAATLAAARDRVRRIRAFKSALYKLQASSCR